MTGRENIVRVLSGDVAGRIPVLPILHTGLAGLCGASLQQYSTDAAGMAQVIVEGARRFRFDGVQMSLGVIAEAEALGAALGRSSDGASVLKERLLADPANLKRLQTGDPTSGGRMPLFREAATRVVEEIGEETFVLTTLRGPFLSGAQLRGPGTILTDMLESPMLVERILTFTTKMAVELGRSWLTAGAHGLLLGEATCSPNFISPALYRKLVLPHHRHLVEALKWEGWRFVGLHVCGNTTAIIEDMISTGVDFLDVDHQVFAEQAIDLAGGRVALRGNLDPSSVFRFGTPEKVRDETERLCGDVAGSRWIIGSGCDIPPGTPAENIEAFVETVRRVDDASVNRLPD